MRRFLIAILALLLSPLPALALDVGVDYDETYDFSEKKTYAWQEGIPAANELNQKRIVAGVEAALRAAGLEKSAEGVPDLYVATEATGEKQIKSSKLDVGLSLAKRTKWGSISLGGSRGNRVREVLVGTLVIAVLDGETQELVWRANASDTISSDPQKTATAIERSIERAFQEFPPGGQ